MKKYGYINGLAVVLLEKATKAEKLPKDKVVVQSLLSGETAIIKRNLLKRISTKYPKLLSMDL